MHTKCRLWVCEWTLWADFLQTQRRLFKSTLSADYVHTLYQTTPFFKQTCCKLSSKCNSSMHQVCICTLVADLCADFMHTLDCRLKSVQNVCKCTLCADFMCRLSADLKWFSEKVCIKSAYAHFLQTCGTYFADFMHTIDFFSSWI